MVHGSFLPLTILSDCHFSFLTELKCVTTSFEEACVGLISHHGQSVSIKSLSDGIVVTTNKFSSVFNELKRKDTINLVFLFQILNLAFHVPLPKKLFSCQIHIKK